MYETLKSTILCAFCYLVFQGIGLAALYHLFLKTEVLAHNWDTFGRTANWFACAIFLICFAVLVYLTRRLPLQYRFAGALAFFGLAAVSFFGVSFLIGCGYGDCV